MGINMKIKPVFILSSLLILFACSSGIKQSEKWEGLKKGKLRVYVRDGMEDIEETPDFEKKAKGKLLKTANDRAVHLLISYIRSNIKERNRYDSYNNEILTIIGKADIKFISCNDEYCEAVADYETKVLIEKINPAAVKDKNPARKEPGLSEQEEKGKNLGR